MDQAVPQKGLKLHDLDIPIARDEVSAAIWNAMADGSYEIREACLATRAAKPGDRILDLGGGIGITACLLARTEQSYVWSFEADLQTIKLARRVLRANKADNIDLQQGVLLPGQAREVTFYQRSDFWFSSFWEHQGPYLSAQTMTSIDIDAFIKANNINYIVMDIEGGEYELLTQARLRGVERIFFELHDYVYQMSGIRDILNALQEKGFTYDPRCSSGPCVLFTRDTAPRAFPKEWDPRQL